MAYRVVMGVFVLLLGASCADRDGALQAKRQQWAAERYALEEQIDVIEARLLVDRARVQFWMELRERRESVSAIACQNLSQHARAIARYEALQREKQGALSRQRRVAVHFDAEKANVR